MDRITIPEFKDHVVRKIYDHEIFLSFVTDRDAELFGEWLNAMGFAQYHKWADRVKSEMGEK